MSGVREKTRSRAEERETVLADRSGWTLRVQSWSRGGTCLSQRGAVRAGPHWEQWAGFSSSLIMKKTKYICQVLC